MNRIANTLKTYFILTKPRLWLLLLYTGIVGYIIGSKGNLDPNTFLILFISLWAGTAGANTVTSYIDRDIDAIMKRTRKRPLPSGRIKPPIYALYFGLALSGIALVTSYMINLVAFLFMLFGLVDNIIIYSLLTKRRTVWNIILGSFSGGAPVIIGYAAATGVVDILSLLWAIFIVIWTPIHIWSLALYYREDYSKAGVPMLPAVVNVDKAIRCIAISAIILVVSNVALPILYPVYMNLIFLVPSAILNFIILYWSLMLLVRPSEKLSWRLFKITSPYLGIIFTVAMIIHLI